MRYSTFTCADTCGCTCGVNHDCLSANGHVLLLNGSPTVPLYDSQRLLPCMNFHPEQFRLHGFGGLPINTLLNTCRFRNTHRGSSFYLLVRGGQWRLNYTATRAMFAYLIMICVYMYNVIFYFYEMSLPYYSTYIPSQEHTLQPLKYVEMFTTFLTLHF